MTLDELKARLETDGRGAAERSMLESALELAYQIGYGVGLDVAESIINKKEVIDVE